jgi:tetratricopeptide (TPR) repeat protein
MSSPALPHEVFDQVTQAWAVQDYDLGEHLLAEACQRYPDHWHLRTCHAAAIGYCSRFRSARAAFDSLIADAPAEKKIHMHGLLGVEWCRIGRHDLAIPLLRAAVAASDPPAPVYEALASALEHIRDHGGAREVLEQGLIRYREHPGMLLVLALIQRRSRDFDLAEATARQVLANPSASPDAKVRAGYELGHALDSQGRFAGAFAAFSAAKRMRQTQLAPFRSIWEQGQRHQQEDPLPTREDILNWRDQAESKPRRLAMLVGCPRSGTTLLERVLDSHPDLISAPETTVFANVWNLALRAMSGPRSQLEAISTLTGDDLRRMRGDYFTQMEDALEQPVGNRLLLDKNPSQLSRVPAILRTFPQSRILMAVRDPRAVAWSCFTQYLPDNAESAAFNTLDTTAAHVSTQLHFWLRLRDRLPLESWHETRYESVVDAFDASARETLSFLGLPWHPQVAEFHANPAPVRSPTYAEAARPVYRDAMEKWRNYEPFLADSLRDLAQVASNLGYPV